AGHPLFLGMVGMHGTVAANLAVMDCDLLLGAGVRFDDRVTGLLSKFAPKAKIIHFDIDPAEINKNVPAHLRVVGHLGWSLPALRQILCTAQPLGASPERKEWIVQTTKWREDSPLVYQPDGQVLKPQYVIQELDRLTESNAILVTDVGQHQMWSAQFYRFNRPRTLVTSGGLGTMGFGLPAAIGAQFGRPDELVVLVTGDGSILMNCQEMATIVEHKLPIKVAIINNQVLGMVRQWQRLFYHHRYAYSGFAQGGTDYVRLAEAFGAVGLRAATPAEVPVVIEKALAVDGPVFMDFQVCPEENVLPMVPAGASLDQMIEGVID
ncbi:MAG: thiamine pyrophosphate-dependent enzyme, partial [Heliobacteriaceae bacterium]|nr:thiamine pyrophosphate-dependent enzyme [Heliobacteriaceae bacterium]